MRTAVGLAAGLFLTIILPPLDAAQPETPVPSTEQLHALLRAKEPARITFAIYHLAARGQAADRTTRTLCAHKDPLVRRAATFALGTTGDEEYEALYGRALRDDDAGVRRAAVFAVGNLAAERFAPLLESATADPQPAVRELAATALGRLGGKDAVRMLIATLDDPSRRVRRAAVVALGALGNADALPPLRKLEKNPTRGVDTRRATRAAEQLEKGHNFGYDFMTLPDTAARFSADTGVPVFVTDEVLMSTMLAAADPDNLDSLKVSMWHVKARTFLDELTRAAGLAYIIEGPWVIITLPAYLAHDTPLELEIAGALYRLGDASAKATLKRYLKQPQWRPRAEVLLGKN